MSRFTATASDAWSIPLRTGYLTVRPLAWEIGRKGSGLWLRVPSDFPFDVSIPRPVALVARLLTWASRGRVMFLNPRNPKYRKAAALHDYALHVLEWDRVSAAAAFASALKVSGVARGTRLIMVGAVIARNFK